MKEAYADLLFIGHSHKPYHRVLATSEGQYKHVVNLGSVGKPFHFLVTSEQIESYLAIARKSVNGYLTIGTFSENGPKKCSGLEIRQYSEEQLNIQLANGFHKLKCITEDHTTPFNTIQNFLFCSFKRTSAI